MHVRLGKSLFKAGEQTKSESDIEKTRQSSADKQTGLSKAKHNNQ